MKITDKASNVVRYDCVRNCDEDFVNADPKTLENKQFLTEKVGLEVLEVKLVCIVCKKNVFFPLGDVLKFSESSLTKS